MDLTFNADEEAFRAEVLAFLRTSLPEHVAQKARTGERLTRDDMAQWHATLNA